MPIDLSGRRIFLASPGGLDDERAVVRDTVDSFNEHHAQPNGVTFIIRAWEQVAPGLGRPQGLINKTLAECDFMILLMGGRWGSPPALDGGYTSGTEEEFHQALALLADQDAALRNVAVLFEDLPASTIASNDEQITRVLQFRDQVERSKAFLFSVWENPERLRAAIEKCLTAWMKPLDPKVATSVLLPPALELSDHAQNSGTDMLALAMRLDEQGLGTQAEIAFGQAISDGAPDALTEFARFMRRSGRPGRALELYDRVLADPDLLASHSLDALRLRARALANIGLIERLRGELSESERHLQEAARTVSAHVDDLPDVYAYVADNLGHTIARLGRLEDAIAKFEEVMALRERFGLIDDLAQSTVNLAHVHMALGNYSRAAELFTGALEPANAATGRHVRANALCGLADSCFRLGTLEGVGATLGEALALNEEIGNSNGIGIARGLLARLALVEGDLSRAIVEIDACAVQSQKSENVSGRGTVLWLQAEVALAQGDPLYAIDLLDEAKTLAQRASNRLLERDIADAVARAASTGAASVDLKE